MSYKIKVQFCGFDTEVVKAIINVRTRMANYLLNDRGYLFLNDVLVIFEAKPTYRGIFEGWIHASVPCNQVGDPHVTIDWKETEVPYEYELTFNSDDIVCNFFDKSFGYKYNPDIPLSDLVAKPVGLIHDYEETKQNIEEKTEHAV